MFNEIFNRKYVKTYIGGTKYDFTLLDIANTIFINPALLPNERIENILQNQQKQTLPANYNLLKTSGATGNVYRNAELEFFFENQKKEHVISMYLNKKFNPTDHTNAVDITDDTNADNDSISHLGKIKTVVTELLKERLFKSYTNDLKTIINEFGLNEEAIARIYDNIMSETQ